MHYKYIFDIHGSLHRRFITKCNQQDVTLPNLFISVKYSTCFRRYLRPSSGAQNCIYSIGCLSNLYYCLPLAILYIHFLAPDDGRSYRLKHVEYFTEINKLCSVTSCWLYLEIILCMNGKFFYGMLFIGFEDALRRLRDQGKTGYRKFVLKLQWEESTRNLRRYRLLGGKEVFSFTVGGIATNRKTRKTYMVYADSINWLGFKVDIPQADKKHTHGNN
jgi:hypothetical protein